MLRRTLLMSLGGLVLGFATVAAGTVLAATPASAHSALVSSTPADGETITTPIDRVDLVFSEAPLTGLDAGLRIEVRDAPGTDVSTGEVSVDGTTMSRAVTPTDGAYTVLWRYVSPDGHPITGELAFTAVLPAPTTLPTATPSASSGADQQSSTTIELTRDDPVVPWWQQPAPWIVAGAVALAGGAVAVATRRARRAPTDD